MVTGATGAHPEQQDTGGWQPRTDTRQEAALGPGAGPSCGAGAEWPLPGADGQVARGQLGARRWTGGGGLPPTRLGMLGLRRAARARAPRVRARLAHEATAGGVGTAWPGQVPQGGQRPLSRVAPTCGPLPTTCGKSGDPQGQGQVAAQRSTGAAPGELPTHTRHLPSGGLGPWGAGSRWPPQPPVPAASSRGKTLHCLRFKFITKR